MFTSLKTLEDVSNQNLQKPALLDANVYLGVPLELRGKTVGTLCAFRRDAGRVSINTINLAISVSRQIGASIENARLFEESRKFRLGLERSTDAVFMTNIEGNIVFANPSL